jgi:hypothetical protein
MQRWIAHQVSQAHKRSVAGRLLHLNLCLIRTFLQFLCILHPGVVLLHSFLLKLIRASNHGKVMVESVMVEDLVIAAFIVGVSVDRSHETCCSTANFRRLVCLGLCLSLSLHLGHHTSVGHRSIFANWRSVSGSSVLLFNLKVLVKRDWVIK